MGRGWFDPFDNLPPACYASPVHRVLLSILTFLIAGCSSGEPSPVTLRLFPGQEEDAFQRTPVPERLVLRAISTSGVSVDLLTTGWPSGLVDLGDYDRNQMLAFEALGQDTTGRTVLRGSTIYHTLWTLGGFSIPVFVGRVGEISRPPGLLPITHVNGLAAIVDARFILSVGGTQARSTDGSEMSPATFAAYDLGLWTASTATQALPRIPRSLVTVRGRWGLCIDDGGASWFDFATYKSSEAWAPEGMTFSEVAGGRVLYGEQGEAYVVGATRLDRASSAVLRVDWEGVLSVIRMDASRAGAAASYVVGRGLVVAGGHGSDPGALLLSLEGTTFEPLAYPPDPVEGAAAADIGNDRLVLVGGLLGSEPAETRVLDLRCTAGCFLAPLGESLEPVGFRSAWARATGPDEMIVIGDGGEADPTTRILRIGQLSTVPMAEQVSVREPRVGATPVALFGRSIALVGGHKVEGEGPLGIEVYIPE